MGKTVFMRAEAASGHGALSVPWRFISAIAAIAACSSLVYVGVPLPDVAVGQLSPRTYVARTRFTYYDPEEISNQEKQARESALNVYVELPDWKLRATRTLDRVFDAVVAGGTLTDAADQLRAQGIAVSPAPVWRGVREQGRTRLQMLRDFMHLLNEVARYGIVDDERMEKERYKRGLIRQDESGGVRYVPFWQQDADGAVALSAARRRIEQGVVETYAGDPETAQLLISVIRSDLGPTLVYHAEKSRQAKDAAVAEVKRREKTVSNGELLVGQGQRVNPAEYEKLRREAAAYHESMTLAVHTLDVAGLVLVVGGIVFLLGWTATHLEPGVLAAPHTVFLVCLVDVVVVAAARGLIVAGQSPILAPVVLVTIMLALAASRHFAVLNAVALSFLVALTSGPHLAMALPLSVGGAIGAIVGAGSSRRTGLLRSGALAGIAMFFAGVGMDLTTGFKDLDVVLEHGGWALLSGVGSGLLSIGLLPLFEVAFGMTTDISLLELSDQNHPALRRLLLEAPGTYHHSLIVGNLSEAGALAIGANALLARVASYYHDLGKVDRPEYFIENEPPGRSRHEGLSPTMSTLIITSHVRDGASLARQHRLPKTIADMIAQHHGTTLVEFFYRAAIERAAGQVIDEQLFRYPGPKPQTREAGIVLLADSVEAASRSLNEPTSARLSKLVKDLTMKRLLDGQFDESGLTLRDLRTLNERFVKVLTSMFHSRVPYPGGTGGGARTGA